LKNYSRKIDNPKNEKIDELSLIAFIFLAIQLQAFARHTAQRSIARSLFTAPHATIT